MSSVYREYASSFGVSMAAHGVLLVVMLTTVAIIPSHTQQPMEIAVEATLIDLSEIRRWEEEQDRLRQAELDRQRRVEQEQRRLKEEQQLAARRKTEQQKREKEAALAAEKKREEEAIKVQQAREERERREKIAAQERLEKERKAAEEAKEKARLAAAEKQRQEALESDMRRQLEVEEKRLAARASGLMAQYEAIIRQKIQRNWVPPASVASDLVCEVHVTQVPGGEVVGVRIGQCNGDAAVKRSIDAAVFRASPFPEPPDPSLFERQIRFTFVPPQ